MGRKRRSLVQIDVPDLQHGRGSFLPLRSQQTVLVPVPGPRAQWGPTALAWSGGWREPHPQARPCLALLRPRAADLKLGELQGEGVLLRSPGDGLPAGGMVLLPGPDAVGEVWRLGGTGGSPGAAQN